MALKPFNSIAGFSYGDGQTVVIDANGNVTANYLAVLQTASITGNLTVANVFANSSTVVASLVTGTLTTNAQPNVTSVGTLTSLSVSGQITSGNIVAANVYSNTGTIGASLLTGTLTTNAQPNVTSVGALTSLSVVGNTDSGNLNTAGLASVTGNVIGGNLTTAGIVSATGNICTAANVLASGYISATGNVRGANLVTSGQANVTGNVIAGNVTTAGLISATGNLTAGNIDTAGCASVAGNITGGNLNTAGLASVTGNVIAGNVNTAGLISATGNITGGNIRTSGCISATSNVTAAWFFGNICGNISGNIAAPGNNTDVIFNNNGNADATDGFTFDSTSNAVVVAGNITGANINTGGVVSATGNLTAANVNTGIVSASGNITALNANLGNLATANYFTGTLTTNAQPNITSVGTLTSLNSGAISSSGNVTAANVLTGGLVSATGNLTAGNIDTAGLASVTGNVIAGNVNTAGLISATGNLTAGNVLTGGLMSATGDITANNFVTSGTGGNITGANVISANTFSATRAVCTANLTATGITNLGNVGNVIITGGSAGYVLTTDGTGNLNWETTADVYSNANVCGLLSSGDINVDIITSANLTACNGVFCNNLYVCGTGIVANSAALSVSSANVIGSLNAGGSANIGTCGGGILTINGDVCVLGNAGCGNIKVTTGDLVLSNGNANVTGNISVSDTVTSNIITANYLHGDGSNVCHVYSIDNASGSCVTFDNVNGTVIVGSQGSYWNFNYQGNLSGPTGGGGGATFCWYCGDGANLSNITSDNICGANLSVTGLVTAGNIQTSGSCGNISGVNTVYANYFSAYCDVSAAGNVYSSTDISAAGNICSNTNVIANGYVSATGNVIGCNFTTIGNVYACTGTVCAAYYYGDGSNISNIYSNANVANYLANSSTTGNIYAGFICANSNITTNANVITSCVIGLTSDVTIAASGANGSINLIPTGNAANVGNTGVINAGGYNITNVANPNNNQDVATKSYVDGIANGLQLKAASNVATTGTLASTTGKSYVYNNGTSGVGATITMTTTGVVSIDGVALTSGMRVLIKDEPTSAIPPPSGATPSSAYNGIYTVTTAGTPSAALVLTRAEDNDVAAQMYSAYTFILAGAVNANSGWASIDTPTSPFDPLIVGTDPYTFIEFSHITGYTGGVGISVTGTVIDALLDSSGNNTIGVNTSNQLYIPAGAILTTPNIGDATGTSIAISGNITAANITANATIHIANSTITYANLTTTNTTTANLFTGAAGVGYEVLIKAVDTVGGGVSLSKILASSTGDYIVYGQATTNYNPGSLTVTTSGGAAVIQVTSGSSNSTAWTSQIRGV